MILFVILVFNWRFDLWWWTAIYYLIHTILTLRIFLWLLNNCDVCSYDYDIFFENHILYFAVDSDVLNKEPLVSQHLRLFRCLWQQGSYSQRLLASSIQSIIWYEKHHDAHSWCPPVMSMVSGDNSENFKSQCWARIARMM